VAELANYIEMETCTCCDGIEDKDTIQASVLWITRIPKVVRQSKVLIQSTILTSGRGEGHSFEEVESTRGGVKQR